MDVKVSYMFQKGFVHLAIKGATITLQSSERIYPLIIEALKNDATEHRIQELIDAEALRRAQAVCLAPNVELRGGLLSYAGNTFGGALGRHIQDMLDEGFNLAHVSRFIENLVLNPDSHVVENLFSYLEAATCVITQDGCFLAYARVACESQATATTATNFEIPRFLVSKDDLNGVQGGYLRGAAFCYDRKNCSDGWVMCKVNPAHVVTVPKNFSKEDLRVCRYELAVSDEDDPGKHLYASKQNKSDGCDIGQQPLVHPLPVETFKVIGVQQGVEKLLVTNQPTLRIALNQALNFDKAYDTLNVYDNSGILRKSLK